MPEFLKTPEEKERAREALRNARQAIRESVHRIGLASPPSPPVLLQPPQDTNPQPAMAFNFFTRQQLEAIARQYVAQDFTIDEIGSIPLSLYTLLGVQPSASDEQCFQRWGFLVNDYNTNPYWNSAVPANWPDRLMYKKSIELAAKMLFTKERRRLYDIHYCVSNCIAVDWYRAGLTPQERDFMMQTVMHKFTGTKVTVDTANVLYDSTIQRAAAARTATQEQWNRELQYFQKLSTAVAVAPPGFVPAPAFSFPCRPAALS